MTDIIITKEIMTEEITCTNLDKVWSLYFFKNDRSKEWVDNMQKVIDFETVEEFWGLMNHIVPPSRLHTGCDYYMFKKDIKPMWEDENNKNGGIWNLVVEKKQQSTHLDQYWLEILMALIGEVFEEDSEEICGVSVNLRGKADRIGVWTSNASNEDAVLRIGKRIKETLHVNDVMEYKSHSNTQPNNIVNGSITI